MTSDPSNRAERTAWPSLGLAAAILVLVAAVYARIAYGGFLWDDNAHVTRESLRSLDGLRRIWFELTATQQYYPILHSAFWVQSMLWGDATLGYHVVNMVLHASAAFLFGTVLHRLAVPGAFWAALIFAVHPVQVETAAWITEQKNTLSTVFYLAAALAYLRFDATRRLPLYFGALGWFVLALLSKSVTATLPAALLVVLWWQRGRLQWKPDVLPLVPWLVVGAVAGLFTAWVERTVIGAEGAEYQLTFIERLLLAGRVVWFYLGKLIWPAELSFIYPRWAISAEQWVQWLPLIAALAALGWLYGWRGRNRGPLAAVLFFGGTLFPVLGFLNVYPFRYSYVADHFQYVASFGIIALAAAGIDRAVRALGQRQRSLAMFAPAVIVAALAWVAWREAGKYRDQETLWRATIVQNPEGSMPWLNLGAYLVKTGRTDEAAPVLEKARKLNPNSGEVFNNLGILEILAGRFETAVPLLERSVKLNPKSAEAQDNLGHALRKTGRFEESLVPLREALRLEPGYPVAANNLGCALMDLGRPAEALSHFETALKKSPDKELIHHNYGKALQMLGRTNEAIAQYQEALRLRPGLPETHEEIGRALIAAGRMADGLTHYERAVALRPADGKLRTRFGVVLGQAGKLPEALAQFETALRTEPDDPAAELSRGIALTGLDRWEEARASFARVTALQPGSAEAHRNLGFALANTGALEGSVTHFQTALRLQPDSVETHSSLSRVLQILGRTQEAEQHRARAEELAKAAR